MDTDQFKLTMSFDIDPVWRDSPPVVRIGIDGKLFWHDSIPSVKSFMLAEYLTAGLHALEIELLHKPDHDPDQALKIKNLVLGDVHSPRFIWQGVYTPRYPEPWAAQQRQNGIQLEHCLRNTDYLGWNGVWRLEFTIPIFTWIHQIEGLGWIYD